MFYITILPEPSKKVGFNESFSIDPPRVIQSNPLTTAIDFQDKKSGRRYRARVAVQVLAKPGSYVTSAATTLPPSSFTSHAPPSSSTPSLFVTNVNPSSSSSSTLHLPGANGSAANGFENGLPNNELEWRTKEHGGLLLKGLLVKLE